MSCITVDEIKTILQLNDSWAEQETVIFSSLAWKRLANKTIAAIYRVDTDTQYTTASAYDSLDYRTTKDYRGYTLINRIDTGTIGDTEKVYVSYSYSNYDEQINILLPMVEADVCEYLNNYFEDDETEYEVGDLKFIKRAGSSHPCITDTYNKLFLVYGFTDGMDIHISGTPRNSGIYHISNAAADKIKLSSNDTLEKESSTEVFGAYTAEIHRIKWPAAIKRYIAYLCWFNIQRNRDQSIASKSLGPSSVSYVTLSSGGYPPSITDGLLKFKNTKTI